MAMGTVNKGNYLYKFKKLPISLYLTLIMGLSSLMVRDSAIFNLIVSVYW